MAKSDETGNCAKCAHQAEIEAARESGDEKEILRLRKICLVCIRGCDRCKFGKRKQALDDYIQLVQEDGYTLAEIVQESQDIKDEECNGCKEESCTYCKHRARLSQLKNAASVAQERIPAGLNKNAPMSVDYAREVYDALTTAHCFKCRRCPLTDDNPSHSGKDVISFDAAEEPDLILPHADPFAFNADRPEGADSRDFDTPESDSQRVCRKSVTTRLPPAVEEALREEICNLSGKLDHVDRALVFFLMAGGSMTDFGKMKWVPKEFFETMSKQAVYGRYKRIVKAVPILTAVAHGMIGKGKGGAKPKPKAKPQFIQEGLFL